MISVAKCDKQVELSRREEFQQLFAAVEHRLYRYVRTLVLNQADAENTVQETAVVLWERYDAFAAGSNFFAWASTVAKFQSFQLLEKKRKAGTATTLDGVIDLMQDEDAGTLESEAFEIDALRSCLDQMSAEDVSLVRYRFNHRMSAPKIAVKLDKSVSSIYRKLDRIYRSLAWCIRKQVAGGTGS